MSKVLSNEPGRGFSFRLAHGLYRLLWRILRPGLPTYLRRRARKGKEDPARLLEKHGITALPAPGGALLWVHGASVGESLSALPLINLLLERHGDLEVLVTTGTVTSAQILKQRLPERCRHQYIPLDHPGFVKRFLDHWKPTCVFWLESEFWPGMLKEIAGRNIPAALVNARISDGTFERWQRRPGLIAPLLSTFSVSLAQDESVAEKLKALGARNVSCPGNLKFASPPLPEDAEAATKLRDALKGRKLIVAAQSADGEEEIVARIHLHLRTKYETLLTIIAPRHPGRSADIETALVEQGLEVSVRSRGEAVTEDTDIYLADTMGELGLFYRLGAPVFLGRSLVPGFGGSNILEPAQLGCTILQGPYTENSASTNAVLSEAEAYLTVQDELALCNGLDDMLQDKARADALGAQAKNTALAAADVLERISEALEPLLANGDSPLEGNS